LTGWSLVNHVVDALYISIHMHFC